jgi:nucleoside-diphosphate-sugar epimerase
MPKKVLVTGMSGLIGGLLKDHLIESGGYELTALNRRAVDGISTVQANIADFDAIQPAFEGQEVVVHLAAYLGSQDWEGQHAGNVLGTYNVFEASRRAGVKRVIFASSGNAIRGFERVPPYSDIAAGEYDKVPDDFRRLTHLDVRPEALYGAAKVWGEALARHFSDDYDMSMICVRIGSVTQENRPRTTRENAIYLSHGDVASHLKACIDAPDDLKFDIFFAVSNNQWNYRDLSHPREVLGWEPQDSADNRMFTQ